MKRVYLLSLLFLSPFLAVAQVSVNMNLLGNWDDNSLPVRFGLVYNDVWGHFDGSTNKEYAIIGSVQKVHIMDVTNPSAITEVASFTGGDNSLWRDMKTFGTTLYCVADEGSEGMMIIDLSDMNSGPQLVAQPKLDFLKAHNIFIDGATGRLYVAGSNSNSAGLIVYDLVADPFSPTKLATVSLPGSYVHDLYAQNNRVYANHGFNGLYIYDFTDPLNPVTLATLTSYPERGYNHSSWLSSDGNHLIFCDETHDRGVKILDISDLDNLTVTDVFRSALLAPANSASIAHNPLVKDDLIFLSYYHDGIQVFDMSDPTDVVRTAYYDTYTNHTDYAGSDGAWGVYPFLPSGNILGSDILNGLFVLELTSSALPVEWLTFDATRIDASVQLHWATATETNSDRFEVERSTDGKNFKTIGTITAAGNSTYRKDYNFQDNDPAVGQNYYRLRQVDYNGQFDYSPTRTVYFPPSTFKVAPNPTHPGTPMQLQLPFADTPFELQLHNYLGQPIWSKQYPAGPPTQTWMPPVLPPGLYLLSAQAGSVKASQKIIIQ
ncbi:MAG: choice-of-anchor B family protein [Bacteroidota bacterium]